MGIAVQFLILCVIIGFNFLIGVFVLVKQPRSRVHRSFFAVALGTSLWGTGLLLLQHTDSFQVFDKVTIHLKNGKDFSIIARNNSHDNKYVQDIRLNGQTINRVWFRHADIANGGTLELTMADTPNRLLGSAVSSFPPASLVINPEVYGK